MMRALRVGKLTLAALQATLKLYRDPAMAREQIPLLRMLHTTPENLQLRAERIVEQLKRNPLVREVHWTKSDATLGGGSLPTQNLPSIAIAVSPQEGSVDRLMENLRTGNPSVVGRIQEEALLLDLKTVHPNEDRLLVDAFSNLNSDKPDHTTSN